MNFHSNGLEGSELWNLSTCSVKVSLKYIEVFTLCLKLFVWYIGEVLIEIHAEMNELLDKQVYVLNDFISGFTPEFTQVHEKCAMKIKERSRVKNF